ncbi:MAG: rhomboid family intramembrane serine protease [Polyangiales bacterium]
MFIVIPVGHEKMEVRRLPWVTIAIAALCVIVQVWSTAKEADVAARYIAAMQQSEQAREEAAPPEAPGADGSAETERMAAEMEARSAEAARHLAEMQDRVTALRDELPAYRLGYSPSTWNVLRMVSSAFVHGGWMHLLGNLLFLYIVGLNLEDRWGRWRFLAFYLAGAVVSALAFRAVHPGDGRPLVGASGAIAAAMGAFTLCYATTRIRFFYAYWLFLRPRWGSFTAAAWVALPLWFAQQLLSAFFEASGGSAVAYSAHVGGFAMGALTALVLRKTGLDQRFDAEGEAAVTTFREEPEFVDASTAADRGDRAAAERSLDALLAKKPDHHEGRVLALRLASDARDATRVQTHLAPALESLAARKEFAAVSQVWVEVRRHNPGLVPDERSVRCVLTAARRHDAPGALVDAVQMALKHHPRLDAIPGALWACADALDKAGRHDEARKALERIVGTYPDDPFAARARDRLGALR